MASCCGQDAKFDGMSDAYKRRLWIVIALNATMFVVEMAAGHLAKSQALQADALDFLGDALTYGISLAVIGASVRARTNAALAKGISLLLVGLWVFGSTLYRVFYVGVPEAEIMGIIGFLALMTNVTSVLLLVSYKDGDANVRSVWLCSRNDAIGNVAVMIAALGVWGTASGWPDLIVAAIMATLFLSSAFQIVRQALAERREVVEHQHA
ncbi:cation transporter [Ruegeria profundi]|uniref:cation transporter n=1 Tax=Ruegeria profundi TaxID=1685378 RepID=UPI001CD4E5BB|nr:cation diffusion facilitator family transporter [Ruegeria profundi]MCA0928843.1 cation diffusion facilitator family transporter [Ruegeria profundi]